MVWHHHPYCAKIFRRRIFFLQLLYDIIIVSKTDPFSIRAPVVCVGASPQGSRSKGRRNNTGIHKNWMPGLFDINRNSCAACKTIGIAFISVSNTMNKYDTISDGRKSSGSDAGPQRRVVADSDVADHQRGGVDVDVGPEARTDVLIRTEIHRPRVVGSPRADNGSCVVRGRPPAETAVARAVEGRQRAAQSRAAAPGPA